MKLLVARTTFVSSKFCDQLYLTKSAMSFSCVCGCKVKVCTYTFSLMILYFCRHALNVQIFLKMHRSDYAEKQLRVMQGIDEDHTLTQLANAWLNLAVVSVVPWCRYFEIQILNLETYLFLFESGWFKDTGGISYFPRFLREVLYD